MALLIVCEGPKRIRTSAGFVAEAGRSSITMDIQRMVH